MGVPIVKTCCFCGSLHIGSLIIGSLFSLWSSIELVVYTLLVTVGPLDQGSHITKHRTILYIVAAAVSALHLLCSIFLVIAVVKKYPILTLPWTIVTGILTMLALAVVVTFISLSVQDALSTSFVEIALVLPHLIRACISVYCIVVVHSYHKRMMLEEDEQVFQHSGKLYQPVITQEQEL